MSCLADSQAYISDLIENENNYRNTSQYLCTNKMNITRRSFGSASTLMSRLFWEAGSTQLDS